MYTHNNLHHVHSKSKCGKPNILKTIRELKKTKEIKLDIQNRLRSPISEG